MPSIVSAAGSARAGEAIQQFGKELGEEYGWSGYVMLNVLDKLDEKGVVLESPG
ncbi:hypothetical protein OHA21_06000 [Actinoplanes sp. NBC_00393]|uniref:hypothetical protein n=1 Tax=Actinoplanes sp. NBC_00393 TaxID=2975953 RepID=UPI002E1BD150